MAHRLYLFIGPNISGPANYKCIVFHSVISTLHDQKFLQLAMK